MTILLAPMEGLLDHSLREVLTRVGGIDRCVSEFIRVSGTLLPERVFTRVVPELLTGGCTRAGVPVRPQLMGSDAQCLAENAARLATLAPPGIDLNFGCPAKVVNRHGGGAALLQDPELLARIVSAVRRAVPAGIPVSAKMRLGVDDDAHAEDCARALTENGACELVVHARTKAHGYRPPAYWERIADIRAAVRVPVIANGEIWTLADALRCRAVSGCDALMIGRGAVADPGLALAIASHGADHHAGHGASRKVGLGVCHRDGQVARRNVGWHEVLPLLADFWIRVADHCEPRHRAGRLKQWLNYLRRAHPPAQVLYEEWRTVNDATVLGALLAAEVAAARPLPLALAA